MPPRSLAISVPTPPPSVSVPTLNPNVLLRTSMGVITLELYWRHAPLTCHNFYQLATARRYYDRTTVHRIVRGFMVQCGDPTGTGRGGDSVWGGKFKDEIHPGLKHVGAGVLSMANSGPDTNGSQFFITLAPQPHLDGKHAIFGRVKDGMTVVQKMGMVATGAGDRPVDPITIFSAEACE